MMATKKTTITRVVVDLNAAGPGKHKVMQHGVTQWYEGETPIGGAEQFTEPFARANLADLLTTEQVANIEAVNTLTAELDAKQAELTALEASKTEELATLTANKDAEISTLTAANVELQAFKDAADAKAAAEAADPKIDAATMRLRLIDLGKYPEQVQAVLDAVKAQSAVEYEKLYAVWEYSTHYYRSDPRIEQFGLQLGLTIEQIDGLFVK